MEETQRNTLKAVVVRVLLAVHTILAYWRVASVYNSLYFALLSLLLLQIGEGLYTVIKRDGEENKSFSTCFLFYLLSTVPAICLLETDRLNRYTEIYQRENGTQFESLVTIKGVTLPLRLAPDVWVSLIEQAMFFLMILGRLILPRGQLSHQQLAQLLFIYIGMASDNSDLFLLFDESPVRQDRGMTIFILCVWCLSMLLYTCGLTADESPTGQLKALIMALFLHDLWYLIVRLAVLARYTLVSYGFLFFLFKNIFIIILLCYKCHAVRSSFYE